MESVGLRLRSGGAVPALKSPPKVSKLSSTKNTAKSSKKSKAAATRTAKAANIAAAMEQAQAFFEDEDLEEARIKKSGKRGREKEEDRENQEEKIIAEAETLAVKVAETDRIIRKLDKRRKKALGDVARYKDMASLAKSALKGPAAAKKGLEIRNKLKQLEKTLLVLQELNAKRSDEIYDAALQEVSEAKHSSKKRRTGASTLSEGSVEHDLVVSEGKHPSP
jgi:hypothetical protein